MPPRPITRSRRHPPITSPRSGACVRSLIKPQPTRRTSRRPPYTGGSGTFVVGLARSSARVSAGRHRAPEPEPREYPLKVELRQARGEVTDPELRQQVLE